MTTTLHYTAREGQIRDLRFFGTPCMGSGRYHAIDTHIYIYIYISDPINHGIVTYGVWLQHTYLATALFFALFAVIGISFITSSRGWGYLCRILALPSSRYTSPVMSFGSTTTGERYRGAGNSGGECRVYVGEAFGLPT